LRDDLPGSVAAEWLAPLPNTDTALMLGLAHTLETEGLKDGEFLSRFTTGYETFRNYLLGHEDGVPKSPEWAAAICGIPAGRINSLAREMAGRRTLICVSYSLQRARYGEQPVWMGLVLAAMLGQIGLPG